MARMHAADGRWYRAVVTLTYDDGRTSELVYGPYSVPAPAKGQITHWKHQAECSRGRYRNPASAFSASGRIDTAEIKWQRGSAEE